MWAPFHPILPEEAVETPPNFTVCSKIIQAGSTSLTQFPSNSNKGEFRQHDAAVYGETWDNRSTEDALVCHLTLLNPSYLFS